MSPGLGTLGKGLCTMQGHRLGRASARGPLPPRTLQQCSEPMVVSVTDTQAADTVTGACVWKAILSNAPEAFGDPGSPSGPGYTTILPAAQLADKGTLLFLLQSSGMCSNSRCHWQRQQTSICFIESLSHVAPSSL